MPGGLLNDYKAHYWYKKLHPAVLNAPSLLRKIAEFTPEKEHTLLRRDLHDLVRMAGARCLDFTFCKLGCFLAAWRTGQNVQKEIGELFDRTLQMEEVFTRLLAANCENSLYDSLKDLQAKHETNPDFEPTLKGNTENGYCRSFVTELFCTVYQPELRLCKELWMDAINRNDRAPEFPEDSRFKEIRDRFYAIPLAEQGPSHITAQKDFPANLHLLADLLQEVLNNPLYQ